MGIPKIKGGTWNSDGVAGIIKNEKYTGNALLQKRYVKDHLTKRLVFNKGNLPKYYAEDTHPAIIDIDTFQKAQEIISENIEKYSGKKEREKYPFTSKIICGICGKNYRHKDRQGRVSWSCSTYLRYGKDSCTSKQIPENILISLATEVLGIKEFDEVTFEEKIKEIQVPEPNLLVFVLQDGDTVKKGWSDRSRRESWNEEARQKARERSLKKIDGGS